MAEMEHKNSAEVEHGNPIYEEINPEDCITVKINDCYGEVNKFERPVFKNPEGVSISSKRIVVILVLTCTSLVLLLGVVAAISGFALFEVSKLKTEIASSHQEQDFAAKVNIVSQQLNYSIELLQQQLAQEYNSRIQQLDNRNNQQYSTLYSRIDQVRASSQNATQQTGASISRLQQQSAKNVSTLDARIASIKSQLNCGGTPGWRGVGYLDMTYPSQSCPSGLALKTYSGLRLCGRGTNSSAGCWSAFFNTGGSQYSRVCGRVRGYHFGTADAFYWSSQGINGHYVEGVSLTHGQSSRSHIWTFAAGLTESTSGGFDGSKCPCTISSAAQPPSFVGNDYFCESGLHEGWRPGTHAGLFFLNDPLWDGQNCLGSCCAAHSPPYFTKNLPAHTSDNIELRICNDNPAIVGDTPIDQLELYVQ